MFFHCKRVSLQIKALRPEVSQLSVVVCCCGAVPGADLPPHWRTTVFCLRFWLLHTVQHKEKQTLQVTWKFWDPRMKCAPIEYSWQYSKSELFPVSLGVTESRGKHSYKVQPEFKQVPTPRYVQNPCWREPEVSSGRSRRSSAFKRILALFGYVLSSLTSLVWGTVP